MTSDQKEIFYHFFDYELGTLSLAATENGLCFVGSLNGLLSELKIEIARLFPKASLIEDEIRLEMYHYQFLEYFAGSRTIFTFPIDVDGTLFQQRVWGALKGIPYGETKSYGEIAIQIGQPGSYRAVGTAIGRNPLLIVVPCHRVIHKNGKLSGYRGTLEMKAKLLMLEKTALSKITMN
ncbi:methylated-DNA--[protein]-cysteine S-methyltransferase [Carnobacterium sp.]|uniref:methylated-DNA--[protein]-cysteine S-methyltransferase n=1 Tax=Carnobacterium sp. TaxID=48221 RepID=UPI00388D108D